MTSPRAAAPIPGLLLGAMAVWGLNLSAVKVLTATFDVLPLACIRMLVAAAALSALLAGRRVALPAMSRRQVAGLVACSALMVYANQILFAEGLLRSSATNAALIMALNPLVSSLLVGAAFRERLTAARAGGIALGFAGVAAIILHRPGNALAGAAVGDLLLVASVVCFAGGGVAVQRLSRGLDPLAISWAIHVSGATLLLAHALLAHRAGDAPLLAPGWQPWGLVLFSGVMATALSNLVWNRAIATIGAARTALALYWVPLFGLLFAVLFLGEPLSPWHGVGLAAVLGGTWLGSRREAPRAALRAAD